MRRLLEKQREQHEYTEFKRIIAMFIKKHKRYGEILKTNKNKSNRKCQQYLDSQLKLRTSWQQHKQLKEHQTSGKPQKHVAQAHWTQIIKYMKCKSQSAWIFRMFQKLSTDLFGNDLTKIVYKLNIAKNICETQRETHCSKYNNTNTSTLTL